MPSRRRRSESQETNYLVSTSDLMAGLLFIFIIALALQMISFNEEQKRAAAAEAKAEEIKNRLAGNDIARSDLLLRMQKKLAEKNIIVTVDTSNGVLRLPEESISFDTGKASLNEMYQARLKILQQALIEELNCFQFTSINTPNCAQINPFWHTLDAVFIEGHTDNQPFEGDTTGRKNRTLSTERANTVYSILLGQDSSLRSYLNPKKQNLFSISGYGSDRPVPNHDHHIPTNDPVNRRIEFRFLMSTPSLEKE